MLWRLPEITIAPDVIIPLFPNGNGITNTLLCTWLTIIALVVIFYYGTRRRDLIPSGMQNLLEWGIALLLGLVESVAGKNAKRFFPLVATFFTFILVANLFDILPGVDTIGWVNLTAIHEAGLTPPTTVFLFGEYSNKIVPWFRPPTSDLNLTFAMALVSVIVTQIFGFLIVGPKQNLSRFFNFSSPINFYVGILELISEIARVISLSFRLFGNIFAGGIVLSIFALLLPIIGDVVFIPFELFVAFIQAFIFSLLTLVFMQIAVTSHIVHETEEEALGEYEKSEEAESVGATK